MQTHTTPFILVGCQKCFHLPALIFFFKVIFLYICPIKFTFAIRTDSFSRNSNFTWLCEFTRQQPKSTKHTNVVFTDKH